MMQRLMRFLKVLVALWLVPMVLHSAAWLAVPLTGFELPTSLYYQWRIVTAGNLAIGVLLSLLVFTPWPARWLRRTFIPIVLGLVIMSQSLNFSLRPDWRPTEPFFFLLIPTILAAAFYGRAGALLSSTLTLVFTTAFRALFHTIGSEFNGPQAVAGSLTRVAILYLVPYLVTILSEAQNERHSRHSVAIEQLATSRERNRVARELHDTLTHSLSALVVQLSAVRTLMRCEDLAQAEEELARAQEVAREGLDEARRAILHLRAAPLENLGLSGAIQQSISDFEERSGVPATFIMDGQETALRREEEQALYRIAEEALENVVRHASATRAEVRLSFAPQAVTMTVEDDGVGLSEPTRAEGFGVLGMAERAELVGGKCTVQQMGKRGTRVQVTLPHREV